MSLDPARLAPMANAIRALSMDAVQAANSGHPGMPMGMADVATVLWSKYLKFDPAATDWPDRDRFVLSAGHGSMLIYSLLHLSGYAHPTIDEIRNFRQLGSPCAGHPENFLLDGVDILRFGERYPNARVYSSAEEMVKDPELEAVWISTPNKYHAPMTVLAAQHGKHVVNVTVDTISQVQSHMLAHQYEGLIERSRLRGKGRGKARR